MHNSVRAGPQWATLAAGLKCAQGIGQEALWNARWSTAASGRKHGTRSLYWPRPARVRAEVLAARADHFHLSTSRRLSSNVPAPTRFPQTTPAKLAPATRESSLDLQYYFHSIYLACLTKTDVASVDDTSRCSWLATLRTSGHRAAMPTLPKATQHACTRTLNYPAQAPRASRRRIGEARRRGGGVRAERGWRCSPASGCAAQGDTHRPPIDWPRR